MSTVMDEQTEAPEVEDTEQEVEDQTTEATEQTEAEPDTFDRDYVQKLRDENAKYRQRAGKADELAAALWSARVAAGGRLADATDLPMPDDADPLDPEVVDTAVTELLARKPHLASRRPRGDVGQGMAGSTSSVDLAGMLRSRA